MFRNIKIRARMLISYGIIIILLLIASVIALFMLQKVGTNLTNFYHNNYTVTVEAWKARRSMQAAGQTLCSRFWRQTRRRPNS